MRALFLALLASSAIAADGNRLAYLDDDSPFWPTAKSPKFITPQWIGEEGVEAARAALTGDAIDARILPRLFDRHRPETLASSLADLDPAQGLHGANQLHAVHPA